MFKKLISNLPFHPNLLGDVAFYVHRLRQETVLRRVGLVFVALTVLVQVFSIIAPSQPSLATNAGDIIFGASSKTDVLTAYEKNRDPYGRTDIRAIFKHYGIGLDEIKAAKKTTIKDNDGRNYINTSRSATQFPDTFVPISGAVDGGIYEFPLEYWRKGQYPQGYPALEGTSAYGFKFWILLKGCGNIVIEKGPKKPELDIIKSRQTSNKATVGDTVAYEIQFRNKGTANAQDVTITDKLADEFEYQSYTSSIDMRLQRTGQKLIWRVDSKNSTLSPSNRWHTINLKLKVKQIQEVKKLVCNASSIDASNAGAKNSGTNQPSRCVTVQRPTCPGTGLPVPSGGIQNCTIECPDGSTVSYNKTCAIPQLSCQTLTVVKAPSWNKRTFQTTIVAQPGAVPKEAVYYSNNKKVGTVAWAANTTSQEFEHTFNSTGSYEFKVELVAKTGSVQASQDCSTTEIIEKPTTPTARISTDKWVGNLTQKIADANDTVANPSDYLQYKLFITNSGDAPASITLAGEYGESIADIMEYAVLTDKGDATYNEKTQFLSWGETVIAPGQTIEKTFGVTVKNPLPATPVSQSNPLSYDYVLHNKYGKSVNVKLNKPASKVVEQTASSLPNTGPGTALTVSVFAAVMFGYFFFRSRLLAKELELVHHEYSAGGA